MLLTEAQALVHLRIEAGDEPNLLLYLRAAEQVAQNYTCRTFYTDETAMIQAVNNGNAGQHPMIMTDAVRAAMLLIAGHLYMNREDVITGISTSELPMNSRYLLAPYRSGMGA